MNQVPGELLGHILHFLAVPEPFFLTNYSLVAKAWHLAIYQFFIVSQAWDNGDNDGIIVKVEEEQSVILDHRCDVGLNMRRSALLSMPYFYLEINKMNLSAHNNRKRVQQVLNQMTRLRFEKIIWCVGNFHSSIPSLKTISTILHKAFTELGAKELVVLGTYGSEIVYHLLDLLTPGKHTLQRVVFVGTRLKESWVSSRQFFQEQDTSREVGHLIQKHIPAIKFERIWTEGDNELVKDIGSCALETFRSLSIGNPIVQFPELSNRIKSDIDLIKSFVPMYRTVFKCLYLLERPKSLLELLFTYPYSDSIRDCIEYCLQECLQEDCNTEDYFNVFIETTQASSWNFPLLEIVASSLDPYKLLESVTHMSHTYHFAFLSMLDSCNSSIATLGSIRDKMSGDSVVHLAVQRNSEEYIKYLMRNPSVPSFDILNNRKESALFDAARYGRYQFVPKLIQKNCDPFAKNIDDECFLDEAMNNNQIIFCRLVIKDMIEKANWRSKLINLVSQQWWCDFLERTLVESISNHSTVDQVALRVIPLLTKFWKGNRTNWLRTYGRSTIIHLACARGLSEVLSEFLDSPLFVPDEETRVKILFVDRDSTGSSAFHLACQSHTLSCDKVKAGLVGMIVQSYAPSTTVLNTPNAQGKTPLELARGQVRGVPTPTQEQCYSSTQFNCITDLSVGDACLCPAGLRCCNKACYDTAIHICAANNQPSTGAPARQLCPVNAPLSCNGACYSSQQFQCCPGAPGQGGNLRPVGSQCPLY